jgi:FkbM family methyltransferase
MKSIAHLTFLRRIFWRLGRKMYTAARGDSQNDPNTNGEYWLLRQALKASAASRTLLDVGANRGNWSAEAIGIAGAAQAIKIHAFEPALETRLMLSARFPESSAVTVQPFALSSSAGETTFYSGEVGGGTNSLSSSSGSKSETVKLTTIDIFMEEANIAEVSMVKIDTEGFDLLVLRGAENALNAGRIEVLQFEYNWRWLQNQACLRDVFDFIRGKPYCFGKLVGEKIEFYDEWHFELDRFFENNYVLVRQDSELCLLGDHFRFDRSNVSVPLQRT